MKTTISDDSKAINDLSEHHPQSTAVVLLVMLILGHVITDEDRETWTALYQLATEVYLENGCISALTAAGKEQTTMFWSKLKETSVDRTISPEEVVRHQQSTRQALLTNQSKLNKDKTTSARKKDALWGASLPLCKRLTGPLAVPPLFFCTEQMIRYRTPESYISRKEDPEVIWTLASKLRTKAQQDFNENGWHFDPESTVTFLCADRVFDDLKVRASLTETTCTPL